MKSLIDEPKLSDEHVLTKFTPPDVKDFEDIYRKIERILQKSFQSSTTGKIELDFVDSFVTNICIF